MSSEKKSTAVVTRARFVHPVKLGANELSMWSADRNVSHVCEATPAGLAFSSGPDDASETVVPWANVVSYDRSRK